MEALHENSDTSDFYAILTISIRQQLINIPQISVSLAYFKGFLGNIIWIQLSI